MKGSSNLREKTEAFIAEAMSGKLGIEIQKTFNLIPLGDRGQLVLIVDEAIKFASEK